VREASEPSVAGARRGEGEKTAETTDQHARATERRARKAAGGRR